VRATLARRRSFEPARSRAPVDFYDLWLLAQSFGRSGVNLPADINRDGVVDRADLALLQAAYIFAAPAETPPATLARPPQTAPPAALPEGEEAP